jgi:hypothetical protein
VGRKALRTRHMNGMEVRKKRLRGFKKEAQGVQVSPLNPLSVAPCSHFLEWFRSAAPGCDFEQPAHHL